MKLFYKKQNLIDELKKLKLIKANDDFKAVLFKRLDLEDKRLVESKKYYFEQKSFAPLFMSLLAIIIVIAFIGAGAGITFASQVALPGEILYPLKIVSERVRVVIASNSDEKARLHFEFSSRRLEEIAELAKDSSSDTKLAEIAAESYKKELNEAQIVLFSDKNQDEIKEAADLLDDITSENKEIIAKMGIEAKNRKITDSLKDALEETIEHNDRAALIILKDKDINYGEFRNFDNEYLLSQATSSLVIDSAREGKVVNKISEVERRILETEIYLLNKEEKGIDIFEAEAKINDAKESLGEAKNFLEQVKYESAFIKAKEAQKMAATAKKIVENMNGDDDEYKLEMFRNYYLPDRATTSAIFNQPASVIEQIDDLEKNNEKSNIKQLNKNKEKDVYNQERRQENHNEKSED